MNKGGSTVQKDVSVLEDNLEEGASPAMVEETTASEFKQQDDEGKKDKESQENPSNSDNKLEDDDDDKGEDKKKTYALIEQAPEYIALNEKYNKLLSEYTSLEHAYSELTAKNEALDTEIESLRQFKLEAERGAKKDKIAEFFMLTDEDKADVTKNIDSYSLDEIEAKLAVICYHNKVSFVEEQPKEEAPSMFRLNTPEEHDDAPEWVKSVRHYQNKEE